MQTRSFGPYHVMGLSYKAGNGNLDFPGVWERFLKMLSPEYQAQGLNYFGLCRCIPGATDGTWEYVAAVELREGAPLPEGLVELQIPRGDYLLREGVTLKTVGEAWGQLREAISTSGREPYCGPGGCDCASHPSFEYYPPDFGQRGELSLFVPVK